MVTVDGQRERSQDDPQPVTAGIGSDNRYAVQVSSEQLDKIIDLLERIHTQLAYITEMPLRKGERLE